MVHTFFGTLDTDTLLDNHYNNVRPENFGILVTHLTDDSLACMIGGYEEQGDGVVFYIGESYSPVLVKNKEVFYAQR